MASVDDRERRLSCAHLAMSWLYVLSAQRWFVVVVLRPGINVGSPCRLTLALVWYKVGDSLAG